ncbi:diadenylate cyclase CdaA [Herbinix luporum]|jgi:diadenylate cyclase|uniref:Diadenylate cyclase n=1 Tax=Herbinix luporum TaxID=1679721 RepID=A0A0K8J8C0_9FIRM|nr:diadenylate cyclase CdaA [Herbinix luporum]MDI9489125.1 diadenylate cyclase CdaA [Bacillota bacterium]CUH93588.1 putative membrane protein [Herbinix luporum]HHT57560.1 TIGR00159 family protein [Herbinix luporum]
MQAIRNLISDYRFSIPKIYITDIIEIIILAFLIYHVVKWIKNTRAWALVKGLVVIMLFWLVAVIFRLNVVIWIISNTIDVGIIAILIVFQPELRKALEQLGKKNIVRSILIFDDTKDKNEKFSDYTLNEIVRAIFELARNKTGALVVIEEETPLNEFVNTGILVDSIISSELLINIFERNTPLHDGAVILRNNRIVAATCYLPLSDNMQLSKDLGTRHRAGIGISEVSDCLTIIVSEETGKVSIAREGKLIRNVDGDYLRSKLMEAQNKMSDTNRLKFWKGRRGNEREID